MTARFAYSTNAYSLHSLATAINRIADLGFAGIEVLADVPHAVPARLTAEQRRELRGAIERRGLAIANVNANTSHAADPAGRDPGGFWPSSIDSDPAVREAKIDYLTACIELAADLGADCVSIATGRRAPSVDVAAADGWLMGALRRLLPVAERRSVKIGIECEPGFHLERTSTLVDLLRRLNHPLLGANLDIGHCVVAGEDPVESIRLLKGKIWNIHLEDIAGGVHRHLIPGEGAIDFARVLATLREIGYERFITLELYPYTDTPDDAGRKGLEFLKRNP